MAVIFWTQADGWSGPNTTDGDSSFGQWSALGTSGDVMVDTVDSPISTYDNAWRFSNAEQEGDRADFIAYMPWKDSPSKVYTAGMSMVIMIPSFDGCQEYKSVDILSYAGSASLRLARRTATASSNNASTYLQISAGQDIGYQNTNLMIGDLHKYSINSGEPEENTPLLIEVDLDTTPSSPGTEDGGKCGVRVFNYSNPDSPIQIGETFYTDVMDDDEDRYLLNADVGCSVEQNKTGTIQDYYIFEFQVRDEHGSHVKNPYVKYPSSGYVIKSEDFSDDGLLSSDPDWTHYNGTEGLLQKSSNRLILIGPGTEECVLATSPILSQGEISLYIEDPGDTGCISGISIGRSLLNFNESTGENTEAVSPLSYYIYVNPFDSTLNIKKSNASPFTLLDDAIITTELTGELKVYYKQSGKDCKICATFGDAYVSTNNEDIYATEFGVVMYRGVSCDSPIISNWQFKWQYPETHDVWELAKYCDGVRGNHMLHPTVIQSPKYEQTIIAAQIGHGAETDKSSKIWAWVVPMDGVVDASDILGPYELDAGDDSTFRVHNPSGAMHDGRAVILWGRDDYPSYNFNDLCGVVHGGDGIFTYPDGSVVGDVVYDPTLTLTTDADGGDLNIYRLHLKGQGFQSGSNVIMPGIRTGNKKAIENINQASDQITVTGHGLTTATPIRLKVNSGGSLPTSTPQVAEDTLYYINRISDDLFTLHLNAVDANSGDNPINFTSAGSNLLIEFQDHGILTLSFSLSGTTFGDVSGGHILDPDDGNFDEWALYRGDDAWWGWVRSSNVLLPGVPPHVVKSIDSGVTWSVYGDEENESYFPVVQEGGVPIDGGHLAGGEFILTGSLTPQSANSGSARRKFVTAVKLEESSIWDAGWKFDRTNEILLLWNFSRDEFSSNSMSGYGQVVSTTSGGLMAAYNIRSSTIGELGAQLVLIQLPVDVANFTSWTNSYLVNARMALLGVGI